MKFLNKRIHTIKDILDTIDNINYTEFVSFFKAVDVSFSYYKNLNDNEKITLLCDIVTKYLESRFELYQYHGFTATTIQVLKDSASSRSKGQNARNKLTTKLENLGYNLADNFNNPNNHNLFFLNSISNKQITEMKQKYQIDIQFSSDTQNKEPDFIIFKNNNMYIMEAKHIKEGGGAQDKQLGELIKFISYTEKQPNIHLVSFLDGIYFNNFIKKQTINKIGTQYSDIIKNLQQNPNNYFINSHGFVQLFKV